MTAHGPTPPHLVSADLAAVGAVHGFFGRAGGVSSGLYASLNAGLGTADRPEAVAENRARCAAALGLRPERLLTLHQIHSAEAVIVTEPWGVAGRPRADAMATDRPGIGLGVLAADCMPVLFIDPAAGIVGAAHAGWRGALAGVLPATVRAMTRLGAQPDRIRAALGPCLRQPQFEVGLELREAFARAYPDADDFFAPGEASDKLQFDLAGFARRRLAECGVAALDDLGLCTLRSNADYFSYRQSRRDGAPDYGRNLSAIALAENRAGRTGLEETSGNRQ